MSTTDPFSKPEQINFAELQTLFPMVGEEMFYGAVNGTDFARNGKETLYIHIRIVSPDGKWKFVEHQMPFTSEEVIADDMTMLLAACRVTLEPGEDDGTEACLNIGLLMTSFAHCLRQGVPIAMHNVGRLALHHNADIRFLGAIVTLSVADGAKVTSKIMTRRAGS